MARTPGSARAALEPLATRDPILRRAIAVMGEALAVTADAHGADAQLYVSDYRLAPAAIRRGPYFTTNCAALRDERAVLVDEAFLLEAEAALRSFELASSVFDAPYLRSDAALTGLVERIDPEPRPWLERLRRVARLSRPGGEEDDPTVETLAMLLVFFVGHELGHLADGNDRRGFGAFVEPGAPLDRRVENAIVKLHRHARELDRLGFGLPGFGQAVDPASEVGGTVEAARATMARLDANHATWFADEAAADLHAATLVQQVLDDAAARDPGAADRRLQGAVRALFAVALVQWHRDLLAFMRKLGAGLVDTRALGVELMANREHYVHAAELFGDVHRFTMLRAVIAIDQWMHARGWVEKPLDEALQRAPGSPRLPKADPEVHRDCLHRSLLLRIHLDTAVKIAHVGASTGWMKQADRRRGTQQLFSMNFETIGHARERLERLIEGRGR